MLGVDFSPLALKACATRGLSELVRARAEAIPLASSSVDAIVATDILEHLDDDLAALEEFRRILKPGGQAVITVPAFQFLWSEHDVVLMHRRRYVAAKLRPWPSVPGSAGCTWVTRCRSCSRFRLAGYSSGAPSM